MLLDGLLAHVHEQPVEAPIGRFEEDSKQDDVDQNCARVNSGNKRLIPVIRVMAV